MTYVTTLVTTIPDGVGVKPDEIILEALENYTLQTGIFISPIIIETEARPDIVEQ